MVLIRLAVKDDLDYLADVEISACRKFIEYLGKNTTQGQGTLEHKILIEAYENNSLWVSIKSNTITGFLAATLKDNNLHIEEISVMYNYQGGGIGKELLRKSLEEASKRKLSLVSLTTDSKIPWNKPFYIKFGFIEIKLEDCYKELKEILEKDKLNSPIAENRIAMIWFLN